MLERFSLLFPLWLLLATGAGLLYPPLFAWFSGPAIPIALAGIMLFMGVTLRLDDFRRVLSMPVPVLCGLALQYAVMPFSAWAVARLLDLPAPLAAGLILVGACPGGTASNVVTYLARADVALSVTMTALSTLIGVMATPFFTAFYLRNQKIDVDGAGLLLSTLEVVVLPILVGAALHHRFPGISRRMERIGAPLAVVLIVLIVASIVSGTREALLESGPIVLLAAVLLHGSGFLWGYLLSRLVLWRHPGVIAKARTISIEVGMQNSGLGVVLARRHFLDPAVAMTPAISSVVHSLLASALAAWWLWSDRRQLRAVGGGAKNESEP